jgi:hypothetical protein
LATETPPHAVNVEQTGQEADDAADRGFADLKVPFNVPDLALDVLGNVFRDREDATAQRRWRRYRSPGSKRARLQTKFRTPF